ncbi:EspA/EspE family type VII secretion system effector [Mycolicibacterium sediminis]|uniref:EspA/EspE family type VII secretion system effector n=1 Tax=Mycolicibacterium sediminis TaxID=1286180 RepID=UPI0013D2AA16|nr:EspA/EspE family type VII secretion system effector [Mycolicibacterium sediminis]
MTDDGSAVLSVGGVGKELIENADDVVRGVTAAGRQLHGRGVVGFVERARTPILSGGQVTIAGMRRTTGVGDPDDGERFGAGSARFDEAATTLSAAYPDDSWTGAASDAYASSTSGQTGRADAVAEADRSVQAVLVREAGQIVAARRTLDDQSDWLGAVSMLVAATPFVGEGASVAVEIAAVTKALGTCTSHLAELTQQVDANAAEIRRATDRYEDAVGERSPADPIPDGPPPPGDEEKSPEETTDRDPAPDDDVTGDDVTGASPSAGASPSRGGGPSVSAAPEPTPVVPPVQVAPAGAVAPPAPMPAQMPAAMPAPPVAAPAAAQTGTGTTTQLASMVKAMVDQAMDEKARQEAAEEAEREDEARAKDSDGDGIPNVDDDTDHDGVSDAEDDENGDGVLDIEQDRDGDGRPDTAAGPGPDAADGGREAVNHPDARILADPGVTVQR